MPILTTSIQEWMDRYCICHQMLSTGLLFKSSLKPWSVFQAWLCIEAGFSGQWMLNYVTQVEWLQDEGQWLMLRAVGGALGWGVRPASPRWTSALLCSRLPCGSGGWEGREKENDRGFPARLFTFYFHGSPHKTVIFLKWGLGEGSQKLLQDRKMFPAQLFQAYPQKFFLFLIFFFNESGP